jgi:hypothetical protein
MYCGFASINKNTAAFKAAPATADTSPTNCATFTWGTTKTCLVCNNEVVDVKNPSGGARKMMLTSFYVPLDIKTNLKTGGKVYYSHPLGFTMISKTSGIDATDDKWDGQMIQNKPSFNPTELHDNWKS